MIITMSENKFIPERLTAVREQLGITSAEAARLTGIKKEMMWKYENGVSAPAEPTLRLISLYLGTSPYFLYGRTDDPKADRMVIEVRDDPHKEAFLKNYDRLSTYQKELINALMQEMK